MGARTIETAFAAIRRLRDAGLPVALACTAPTTDYRNPSYLARLRGLLDQAKLTHHVRILGVVPREDYVS